MLRNVLIVKLAKLYTVNLYVFLSALYMLQYVPIVIILVIVYFSKKKKKKKKKKNNPYFGMGKNTKVMPQYLAIYLFLLGKGGNPYVSKPYIKTKVQVHFLLCPQHEKIQIQTKHGQRTSKLPKNKYIFLHKFCTFPVTEGNEI